MKTLLKKLWVRIFHRHKWGQFWDLSDYGGFRECEICGKWHYI